MGDIGSLHTVVNMLQFKQPDPAAIEFTIVPSDAASIFVEEPFELIVTVKNRGAAALATCSLLLPCNSEASVIAIGATEISIPAVAPGGSCSLVVHMLPVEHGLREVTGFCVHDAATFLSYQASAAARAPSFTHRSLRLFTALPLTSLCRWRPPCSSTCSARNKQSL